MNIFKRITRWYKHLPNSKQYIEVITAVLTVPVLLTVLITNWSNLNRNETLQQPSQTIVSVAPPTAIASQEPLEPCKKEVGPVSIVSPQDGEIITQDPVTIDIAYQVGEYCAVVWAYRINGSSWSPYTDKAIDLYNLASGEKNLEVRVKSIASSDQETLKRTFTYRNTTLASPTPDTVSTVSAN